jgi:hypothetical protein
MIIGLESGKHNEDLESSAKRIKESGSWKRQRVVMLIPAGVSIPTKVYLSHCSLIFPPNQGSYKMAAIGMEVGEAFSEAIEQILEHPELSTWEYILTIEHDNIPQPDALVKLLERMEQHPEFSCIGGLYWTKGEGGVPQIWGDPNDALNFRPQAPDPNGGLVECCGTGMGFNLWRMSMFKDSRLRKPFFKTLKGHEGQGVGTQDLYFWGDARKYGHRCAIDCSVKIGHYDNVNDITW